MLSLILVVFMMDRGMIFRGLNITKGKVARFMSHRVGLVSSLPIFIPRLVGVITEGVRHLQVGALILVGDILTLQLPKRLHRMVSIRLEQWVGIIIIISILQVLFLFRPV